MANRTKFPAAACAALAAALLCAPRSGSPAPSPQEDPPAAERARRARRVRISVVPAGARLWIDGVETSWFGATLVLGVGVHRVRADVPGSRCCRAWSGAVRVEPATHGEDAQRIVVPLDILPAKVVLVDAPRDARLSCRDLGLITGLGELTTVRLREPEWRGLCEFHDGAGQTTRGRVRIDAGEVNPIPWPEP